jgi:hypothetical protein
MSGRRSRDKGSRGERAIVHLLLNHGFAARKVSAMYRPGEDVIVPLLGSDRAVEVKVRGTGFAQIYRWLGPNFALVLRRDRDVPLIVLRLEDAAAIAALAERGGQ